ncbi:hypothetical protein EJB05_21943, partial [Eragrostis curvula]
MRGSAKPGALWRKKLINGDAGATLSLFLEMKRDTSSRKGRRTRRDGKRQGTADRGDALEIEV